MSHFKNEVCTKEEQKYVCRSKNNDNDDDDS